MDGYLHVGREELERRIRATVAGWPLPSWATGYNAEFGAYPVGDEPAVWIGIEVPTELKVDQAFARKYIETVSRLRQDIADVAPGFQPMFRMTMASTAAA